MGIESEQLVFDYLSRVGDLAQQRGLPSGARMRLVASLRAEIDAQRADQKADSVPGVKRMLARLGTPEAVVRAAAEAEGRTGQDGGAAPGPRPAPAAPPSPGPSAASGGPGRPAPWAEARERLGGLIGKVPAPRDGDAEDGGRRPGFLTKRSRPAAPEAPQIAAPPHLAAAHELGDAQDPPDWWRVEAAPYGPEGGPQGPDGTAYGAADSVPGFVGGIELPEVWEHPEEKNAAAKDGAQKGADGAAPAKRGGGAALPALLRRALGRRPAAPATGEPGKDTGTGAGPATDGTTDAEATAPARLPLRAWLSPVPALAVLLLLAGAVTGSWLALAGGWGLAYVSRRLGRTETKFAALGVPGVFAGGLVLWIWGRSQGRWGDALPPGHLGQELLAALPATARAAAIASALFLLWRLRRTARGAASGGA
ncbi:hypothetical protein ADL22_22620 [Streptomyces sp. NRRL F-4489]|uniref:hypothetical protein n=1 Tax=Streptomyces sp. NRRL F-4489 TaxID=1609095 RepID=UPI0007476AD4|nr:hypothetical protein [Streptomyces sp. NRRL F-4489]KUL37186.1 hypothetical protein ADL22_22620 [Streptomyces sp. NRRL F-4489]